MKRFVITACFSLVGLVLLCQTAHAGEFSKKPDRSIFVGFDMGAGFDMGSESRSPADTYNDDNFPGSANPEAYSLGAFLFGLYGGFRFNEVLGIELGWHEQQHETAQVWGGHANYEIGHLALRLAIPLKTRQTLMFRVGPTFGGFSYGEANIGFLDDNSKYVVGGLLGFTLEHEIAMGIVGTFNLTYLPSARLGGDETIQLCMHVDPTTAAEFDFNDCSVEEPYQYTDNLGTWEWVLYSEKHFSDNQFVQVLWISLGLQFEWIFR